MKAIFILVAVVAATPALPAGGIAELGRLVQETKDGKFKTCYYEGAYGVKTIVVGQYQSCPYTIRIPKP